MISVVRFTSADLRYDHESHTTTLPDGRDVPHVTKVLAETGVATDFESVMLISRRVRDAVEDRRLLGSIVHQDCHAYDDEDLLWATVSPHALPYVKAWATCRANLHLTPLYRERQVFNAVDEYTGILDGVFAWTPPHGVTRHVLIDLKIGDPAHAGAQYQTAAYVAAILSEHPTQRIDERWAVQLVPDRDVPYVITPYGRDWRADYRKFQAFLTTYRCQRRVA